MTEQNPLVSIIVRTKDRPKLLKAALRSVSAQTYRPIEVVIVNDGGSELDIDDLKSVLGDVLLNYTRLEKNTGRAHAGNVGIENATGMYLGFLDDDDELYPQHVAVLYGVLAGCSYKVAYTDAEVFHLSYADETGDYKETRKFPRESVDFSLENLLLQNYISFMNLMFCREVLIESGGFDEEFDLCEDWDLIIRIGVKYSFYHVKEITAKYNFWSGESQVTIGHKKLAPYRYKVLVKHSDKITPKVLYVLFHEGKWIGTLTFLERISCLNSKVRDIENDMRILQSNNRTLLEDNKLLQNDNEILLRDINILQSNNRTLLEDNKLLQNDNEILQGEAKVLRSDNETLRAALDDFKKKLLPR